MSEKKYLLVYWNYVTDSIKADIKTLNNLTANEVVEVLSSNADNFEFRLFEHSDEITGVEYGSFSANAKLLSDLRKL